MDKEDFTLFKDEKEVLLRDGLEFDIINISEAHEDQIKYTLV